MTDQSATLAELAQRLAAAEHVAVLTGAGVSAESGLPTFRDAMTGLWSAYRPEDLATPAAFARNPKLVWEWYAWRRQLAARAEPNPAHRALADLERLAPRLTLITQNVDGLHQRAGSRAVVELHGNLQRVVCSAERVVVEHWDEASGAPPTCPRCGSLLRPDVVWFGEALPAVALEQALAAAARCDLFLAIGTSGVVEPAASLPRLAARSGAAVAVINLEAAAGDQVAQFVLRGPAGSLLPALVQRLPTRPKLRF